MKILEKERNWGEHKKVTIEEQISKMDDEDWAIPKETLLKEISEGRPVFKKIKLLFLFEREGITSHLQKITMWFTQNIEFSISDVEDFNHLFMRIVQPAKLSRTVFMDGTLIYINMKEGSTQPLSYNVAFLQQMHIKTKKVGKETKISKETAERMRKDGTIFCKLVNDIATNKNEAVKIYQRS